VLSHCDFDKLAPGDFDSIAGHIARRIIVDGLLTRRRILAAFVAVGLVAFGAFRLTGLLGQLIPGVPKPLVLAVECLSAIVAAAAAFMFAGRYVDYLVANFLRPIPSDTEVRISRKSQAKRMADLPTRNVEHVFCATDLVTGLPVYVSSHDKGILWRRVFSGILAGVQQVHAQRWDAGALRLAEVVRASAAFPGIPPRRIALFSGTRPLFRPLREHDGQTKSFGEEITAERRRELDQEALERELCYPSTLFLGDGGLWNNLGTQVLREDRMARGQQHRSVPRMLLCVNASGALKRASVLSLQVPLVAVVSWLRRCLDILSANTIEPRTHSIAHALGRRVASIGRERGSDNLDVVSDLREVSETALELGIFSKHRYDIAAANPETIAWEGQAVQECEQLLKAWDCGETDRSVLERINKVLMSRPARVRTDVGAIDHDTVDDLKHSSAWVAAEELSSGDVAAPTTLGRIDLGMARRLLARGYVNTFLMSWMIERPYDIAGEISRIAELPTRIDRLLIVPGGPAPVGRKPKPGVVA
jgi:hypothetical protein